MPQRPAFTPETVLAVLTGLALSSCDKKPGEVAPEPPSAASAAAAVSAQEVPSASPSAEKAGACAPGACAPGQCGANEKK